MIDHLNAYAIGAKDVRGLAAFYRDRLGFQQKELSDNFAYLTFGPKGTAGIALVHMPAFQSEIADRSTPVAKEGLSRGYFAIFLEDADREYEELRSKGVEFVTPPTTRPDGQRYAFFRDPEGNLWEISHFPKPA